MPDIVGSKGCEIVDNKHDSDGIGTQLQEEHNARSMPVLGKGLLMLTSTMTMGNPSTAPPTLEEVARSPGPYPALPTLTPGLQKIKSLPAKFFILFDTTERTEP